MTDAARLLEAAFQLAPRERAELVEALTASLDGSDLGDAWETEIRRRIADVDAGRVKPVPGDQVFSRIEQRPARPLADSDLCRLPSLSSKRQ